MQPEADPAAQAARLEARANKIASNARKVDFFVSFSHANYVFSRVRYCTAGSTDSQ